MRFLEVRSPLIKLRSEQSADERAIRITTDKIIPTSTPIATRFGNSFVTLSRSLRRSTYAHLARTQPSTPLPLDSPLPSTPNLNSLSPFSFSPVASSSTAPTLRTRTIRFGEYNIQTWHDAPFPEEYANLPDRRLWICEVCLKYMRNQLLSSRHRVCRRFVRSPSSSLSSDDGTDEMQDTTSSWR